MLLALNLSVGALLFAIGLHARFSDAAWLWRRPRLLGKSLLAMYGVIPAVAVAMAVALDLPRGTEAALVVLALCAGAPLLPKRLVRLGGDPAYVFSLVVTTSLLAIITIPAALRALAALLPAHVEASPTAIAAALLRGFLLPLGAGMGVRLLWPRLAERLGGGLFRLSAAALLVCSVFLLVAALPGIFSLGAPSLLAFAAFVVVSLATGHLLGGPDPGNRTSLAVACATRHVGLALLVASQYPSPRTLELVAGYLFVAALVSIPYVRWRRRVLEGPGADPARSID